MVCTLLTQRDFGGRFVVSVRTITCCSSHPRWSPLSVVASLGVCQTYACPSMNTGVHDRGFFVLLFTSHNDSVNLICYAYAYCIISASPKYIQFCAGIRTYSTVTSSRYLSPTNELKCATCLDRSGTNDQMIGDFFNMDGAHQLPETSVEGGECAAQRTT